MKTKTISLIGLTLLLCLSMTADITAATKGVDATLLKRLNTSQPTLDVAVSADGKLMYVLVPGQILVYSNFANTPINRIPVSKNFDRLTLAEKIDVLILASSSDKQVEMIQVALINEISTEGSPIIGPSDAVVTIAVFDDYQ